MDTNEEYTGVRVITDGDSQNANELCAVAFGFFERLFSSYTQPYFVKQLFDALPTVEEEKQSSAFPFVAKARSMPPKIGICLRTIQKASGDGHTPYLANFLIEHSDAASVPIPV